MRMNPKNQKKKRQNETLKMIGYLKRPGGKILQQKSARNVIIQ